LLWFSILDISSSQEARESEKDINLDYILAALGGFGAIYIAVDYVGISNQNGRIFIKRFSYWVITNYSTA